MPPQLALLLCVGFILTLLVRDVRSNPGVSHALWIPVAWIAVIGSRLPSDWRNAGEMASPDAYLEGSPLDRNVFLALIVLGLFVILRRSVSWRALLTSSNTWIAIFFLYTFISIGWSDFPLTAFKRWHKVLGHVIMAMVVLSDPEPEAAFRALFRRCGYLLIPLSVLCIKYYPEFGRGFDIWTGEAFNTGVTINKNALGNLCVVMALFFLTSLFAYDSKRPGARLDRYIQIVFLAQIAWLLSIAHSASSLGATYLGAGVILSMKILPVRRHFTALLVTACLTVGVVNLFIDVKATVIETMDRDPTLTGRTDLWDTLAIVQARTNPWIGVGFESFWLGDRLAFLWERHWWRPNQAHNGFYETYLNLGLVGLLVQCGMILACYMKARRQTLAGLSTAGDETKSSGNAMAPFYLAFVLAIVAFNMTDATFKAIHLSFFVFFMIALDYQVQRESVGATVGVTPARALVNHGGPFRPPDGRRATRELSPQPGRPALDASEKIIGRKFRIESPRHQSTKI